MSEQTFSRQTTLNQTILNQTAPYQTAPNQMAPNQIADPRPLTIEILQGELDRRQGAAGVYGEFTDLLAG